MKRLLLPLLVALALPTACSNATNYVECEAISDAMGVMLSRISSGYQVEESENNMDKMMRDAKKNNCYWFE
tara:strand:- start:1855 stop:2067 length:213 start_codon:yes stop_codon:yes gene_type:complete